MIFFSTLFEEKALQRGRSYGVFTFGSKGLPDIRVRCGAMQQRTGPKFRTIPEDESYSWRNLIVTMSERVFPLSP